MGITAAAVAVWCAQAGCKELLCTSPVQQAMLLAARVAFRVTGSVSELEASALAGTPPFLPSRGATCLSSKAKPHLGVR